MRSHSTSAPVVESPPRRRTLLGGILTIAAAVAVALTVWLVAVPTAGVVLSTAGTTVGPAAVTIATLLAGCTAWLALILLRSLRGGLTEWTVLGCVVLLVSLAAPPLSGASGTSLLVLELMHLVVGATVLTGFRLALPPRYRHRTRAVSSDANLDVAATPTVSE